MSTEVIMSNKNKQIRQSFTLEFKQSAAKLFNEKGYSQQQAADSLSVSSSALGRWVRAERGSSNTAPVQKKIFNLLEQDELTRLRKEVATVTHGARNFKKQPSRCPIPYAKKQFAITLRLRADTGRLLFGG
jgi:transposase